jgi:hypothetical protein
MSDHHLTMTGDGGVDDLPRTLRREREARDREARQRGFQMSSSASIMGEEHGVASGAVFGGGLQPAAVRQFDVRFVHLMLFCIKAVFAAIPALFILGVMLWFAGHALQTYFPKLVHTEIIIRVPR